MFNQTRLKTLSLAVIVAALAAYAIFGGYFAREIVIEIALLAMLAVSLDLVAGYGGMISLCHGAIYGIGAYTFGTLTALSGVHPLLALPAALIMAALFGWLVGAVTANTQGIFFIMATLAFGQMAYVIVFESRALGGDDGMSGIERLDLAWLGIDLGSSLQFALLCLAGLVLVYSLAAWVLRGTFGRTLVGIRSNEDRMAALGLSCWRHKAKAFAFSAALAGFAGTLAAQHTQFISPEYLIWTLSGEAMVVVILGGLGTLIGPIVGAVVLITLKYEVGAFTNHWHMVVGAVLIVAIMAGARGIYGQMEHWLASRQFARNA